MKTYSLSRASAIAALLPVILVSAMPGAHQTRTCGARGQRVFDKRVLPDPRDTLTNPTA